MRIMLGLDRVVLHCPALCSKGAVYDGRYFKTDL